MNSVHSLNIADIPRTYTGLAEWLACILFSLQLKPRLPAKKYIPAAFIGLTVQCAFLVLTKALPIIFWIPCMIAAVMLMLAMILILCDINFLTGAYTCVRAFVLAEFAASLEWQIHCYAWPDNNPAIWQRYGQLAVIYGMVFLIMWFLERRCQSQQISFSITGNELLAVVIVGILVFAISNLSFVYSSTPFSSQYSGEIFAIRTLVDLGGVAILYAYHAQCNENRIRNELGTMQTILENQYAQYRMSRDSIEMINRKYHDLKHQIAALRAETDASQRNRWLDEIEEDIRAYEAQNKTGNSVLDTLLTGKSLYCQKHNIGMTVVADGRRLGFMDVMDICTIFGNALDNAIECELKLQDKSKRMIHLSVTVQKQFLLLQVENYCPVPPRFQGGLPASTKQDTLNHGFGLKSIRFTARKYGGTITVKVEEDWFILKVLIPLPESETADLQYLKKQTNFQ